MRFPRHMLDRPTYQRGQRKHLGSPSEPRPRSSCRGHFCGAAAKVAEADGGFLDAQDERQCTQLKLQLGSQTGRSPALGHGRWYLGRGEVDVVRGGLADVIEVVN